ncbi:MAG: hypothetical protein KF889_06205 [Alphaproteobacteria bacterium]|nr:hypothetical protein [Alphaproteobacteria bacterium]MCW5740410.1 hypothetical protein [Alphaproteobacteria bacterium]
MVKPVLGGPGPTIKLFHYGAAIHGSVRKNSFWTDFESTSKDDISRITGQPAMYFKVRSMVLVNRDKIDFHFTNVATAMKPGLGAFDEYKNKAEIPVSYLETMPLP